jgi:hypothetical protein
LSGTFIKAKEMIKALQEKLTLSRLMFLWFAISMFLSISVFLRFHFPSYSWIVNFNIGFYFAAYYVMPALCFLQLVPFFCPTEMQMKSKKWRFVLLPISLFLVIFLWICLTINFRLLPDYATSIIPMMLAVGIYFKFSKPQNQRKVISLALSSLTLLLPYSFAYFGYFGLLNSAAAIGSSIDKATFISQVGMAVTGNGYLIQNLVRANFGSSQDFTKFLISGAGACGETSMFEQDCLEKLGFVTLKVGFPGEDHAFVEVKINSTWLVIDPGYNMMLVSRSYRAAARISEVGTISYVTGNRDGAFIELTQDYVPTDTIIIRVTRGNKPINDVSVNLVHQLRYDTSSYPMDLPGDGFSFHTDSNGTIIIHLGKIGQGAYNTEFGNTDPFYQVYINGEPTNYKINSTGTGLTTFVPVDLSKT